MKLVIDTVVVVRALMYPRSRPGLLVHHWRDSFTWIVSPAIAAEYQDVTTRPRLMSRFTVSPARSRAVVAEVIQGAVSVTPVSVPAICRDPGDDKFLAAAQAAGADYLVSEDRDLLGMGEYEGIPIVSTQTMIDLLTARDAQP